MHVVPEMTLSASYRPMVSPLRAAGIPKPSRNAWYLDPDSDRYKRLTVAVRTEIVGVADRDVVPRGRRTVRLPLAAGRRRVGLSAPPRWRIDDIADR